MRKVLEAREKGRKGESKSDNTVPGKAVAATVAVVIRAEGSMVETAAAGNVIVIIIVVSIIRIDVYHMHQNISFLYSRMHMHIHIPRKRGMM